MTRPDFSDPADAAAGSGLAGLVARSPDAAALEALLAATPLFLWQADAGGRITWVSAAGLATLGMRLEQVRDAGWLAAVDPAHRERVAAAWRAALAAGVRYEIEFPVRDAASGAWRWHLVRADPVRADPGGADPVRSTDGRVERWVGLALDVQATRGVLAARERELAALTDHAPAIIARFDRAGRHLFVSRAIEAATGRAVAHFLGRTNAELGMPPELCARWDAALAAVFATGHPQQVEFAFAAPEGERVFRSVIGPEQAAAGGRIETVIAVAQDVTELRAAQAALARSHAAERAAAERVQLALAAGAIAGTWDWDLATDRITVDERFADTFGIDPALGRSGLWLEQVIATVHPEDVAGLRAAIAEARARGGAYSHEYRVRGRDGRWRWIEANGRVDLGPDGRARRFPGVLLDAEARRRLAAERDRAQALLAAFLEAVPGVVYAKDRDGRMLLANAGAAALIGKPPEAFLGRTDAQFLDDPAQAAAVMANDRRIMDAGVPEQVEETVNWPDGRRAVWLSAKAPFRDAAGRTIGLVGASIDITARRDAEQRLRAILETVPVGIVQCEAPSGRVVGGNRRAEAIFGHPVLPSADIAAYDEWVGFHADGTRVAPHEWPMARVLLDGVDRAELEVHYRRGDTGELRWVRIVGAPIRDAASGAITGGVVVSLDIDAERRAIAALTEADARKDEFLAMLAHELRNPLAPVLNAVKLLARREVLTEPGAAALAMIDRSARHMKRLVDDLLEVSRITRGKIELQVEPMLLTTTVANVVEALLPAIEAKRQTLEVVQPARPLRIQADPVRVTQILENLVTNASKYTPAGGAIRIEVADCAEEACVRVVDDGIGLPPELLAGVFELFVQAHAGTEHAAGGLGIGLAMVRRLAELHGGRAWAESAGRGRGSTFVVCLPKVGPARAASGLAEGAGRERQA